MNFGEIKAFLGNKPEQSIQAGVQKQLREEGLRQAEQGVSLGNVKNVSFSSQTTVGLRVYNNALNQSLTVDGQQAKLPKPEEKTKSLFDFEEIARNVLRFVGGVITSAAKSGADEAKLSSLFEQARSGVAKGIKMAEKDLQGFMNEDISKGISASADLIEDGIRKLQEQLLGKDKNSESESKSAAVATNSTELSAARSDSGELLIRTRDGDEVTIRFEDLQRFEFNRSQLIQSSTLPTEAPAQDDIQTNDVLPRSSADDVNESTAAEEKSTTDGETQQGPTNSPSKSAVEQQQGIFVARDSFSFSVNGELDEGELKAIGNLVADANELAATFFDGDMDQAFNKALELGFDDQELTGFALQLTRQEQVKVVNTYETISHYDDEQNSRSVNPAKVVEPISDYLEKMLNVFEQSQQTLADGREYEKLLNGLVNRMQDLGTDDLVDAINRFHSFNARLLNNLPQQGKESTEGQS